MLKKMLFQMAKSPLMGKVVGNAFRFLASVVPVQKVFVDKKVLAFHHPQPCYKNHLILSPRKAIKNLLYLAADGSYFEAIFQAAQHLSATLPQYGDGFTLIANGGKKQEVQQVHFHMFTDCELVNMCAVQELPDNCFYYDASICILPHPNPNWTFHFIVQPISRSPQAYFQSVLHSIDLLNAEYNIVQNGYSLIYQHTSNATDALPVFHIISGKKLH